MMRKLKNNKRGYAQIFIIIGVIAGLITILGATGLLDKIGTASFGDYNIVYKQNYGHVCCVKSGSYDYVYTKWLDEKKTFSCNIYTDECEIYVSESPKNLLSCSGGRYSVNGGSNINFDEGSMIKIPAGSTITFSSDFGCADNTRIDFKAKTFYLKGQENGKVYTQESCVLSSDLRRKTEVTELNEIPFDQCQNYFLDFIQTATMTYDYYGNDVVCQARAIYETEATQFKDGQTRLIQGNKIKNVECCPNENNCGENFEFIKEKTRECTYSFECANGGDPWGYTQTTTKYQVCESGTCVEMIKNVECTSTAVCISRHGEGYVCDLSVANYGTCKQATTPHYCGDGYCDIGESKDNCPDDCELECADGEKLVTKEKKVDCTIGFPVYWGCDTEVTKECKSGWDLGWLVWVVVIVVGIIAIKYFWPVLLGWFKAFLSVLSRFFP